MAGHAGKDVAASLSRWQVAAAAVREQMYEAPTARERERWHAVWLALQGWSAAQVAAALGRDPHTVGLWLAEFRRGGPAGLTFRHTGGPAPALTSPQQAVLKAAVQRPPREAGIEVASWHWNVVRRFVRERFGVLLGRSSCRASLHRLGCVRKRPKKRLLTANEATRTAFVAAYADLRQEATTSGAQIFFVDEAHVSAGGDLRGMWVLTGTPALVDSTSPRYGEKASSNSAICLETGEVEVMPLEGNSSAATSAAFLQHLRARQNGPLVVIWDTASVHGGAPLREFLRTPKVRLRLVRLPAYSPDFNADEHSWGWVREEVTANTCFGTAAKVRAQVDRFFTRLAALRASVMQRCHTALQTQADAVDALLATASQSEAVRTAA